MAVIEAIAADPRQGDPIRELGGLRKVRFGGRFQTRLRYRAAASRIALRVRRGYRRVAGRGLCRRVDHRAAVAEAV